MKDFIVSKNSSLPSGSSAECPDCGAVVVAAERTLFGKMAKAALVLFSLSMVFWLLQYYVAIAATMGDYTAQTRSDLAPIGIGTGLIVEYWFIGGAFLGLLVLATRPKKKVVRAV